MIGFEIIMRSFYILFPLIAAVQAISLQEVCTVGHAQSTLAGLDVPVGIKTLNDSVTANAVYNYSMSDQYTHPDATIDFCNVTFAYSHHGQNDRVVVKYWLPAPEKYQGRFLSTGGGGYQINSGEQVLPGGVIHGATAGQTDGGYGSFDGAIHDTVLLANGTLNWPAVHMHGYQAIHEMTLLGKEFTKKFFKSSELFSYYEGCSEGGREGWSQVQRFPDLFDGVIVGSPAIRLSFAQVFHLWPTVLQHSLNYYPPPCELETIQNLTTAACDLLDGLADGVVARSDLCRLKFDINSLVGEPYSCAPNSGYGGPPDFKVDWPTPAQNGTISVEAVHFAQKLLDGWTDSEGKKMYVPIQYGADFQDAQTRFNNETNSWIPVLPDMGTIWVSYFLEQLTSFNTENMTFDTLRNWVIKGLQRYGDTLDATWPDLTPFQTAGGKIIHYHGELEGGLPAGSSVHYWNAVRKTMYPDLGYNASVDALSDFYRFYMLPGGGHCQPISYQPNAPFPQNNLAVMIDWVENGNAPNTLNATIVLGENAGKNAQICPWPSRPRWHGNGTALQCEYDQQSLDTWEYKLDSIKVPVY